MLRVTRASALEIFLTSDIDHRHFYVNGTVRFQYPVRSGLLKRSPSVRGSVIRNDPSSCLLSE
jgi:hypothetical protein